MSREEIKEYRLRAFYPNYFALKQILSELSGKKKVVTDTTLFPLPELEYKNPEDQSFHKLTLKNTNVIILVSRTG